MGKANDMERKKQRERKVKGRREKLNGKKETIRLPDVLFRVAFDDIKSGVDWVDVIIRGIETSILRRHRRPDARRRSVAICDGEEKKSILEE